MDFQALMQIAEQMSIPELERLLIDLNALLVRRKMEYLGLNSPQYE